MLAAQDYSPGALIFNAGKGNATPLFDGITVINLD
jgi:hypothetical protein